jgi:hypothetical protein
VGTFKLHKLPFLRLGRGIFIQEEQTRLIVFSLLRQAVMAVRRGQMARGKMVVTAASFPQAGTVEAAQLTTAVLAQRVAQHLEALAARGV